MKILFLSTLLVIFTHLFGVMPLKVVYPHDDNPSWGVMTNDYQKGSDFYDNYYVYKEIIKLSKTTRENFFSGYTAQLLDYVEKDVYFYTNIPMSPPPLCLQPNCLY